jgi:hypothetical protein
MAEGRERVVELLREQEKQERADAAAARDSYDKGATLVGSIAEAIKAEARAGAFASAVDIVEGIPF